MIYAGIGRHGNPVRAVAVRHDRRGGQCPRYRPIAPSHDAYRWLCGGVQINDHTLADVRVDHGETLDALLTDSGAALNFSRRVLHLIIEPANRPQMTRRLTHQLLLHLIVETAPEFHMIIWQVIETDLIPKAISEYPVQRVEHDHR